MSTLEFGSKSKSSDDYAQEIYDAVGVVFPLTVIVEQGVLKQVIAETTWKTGGTTPIEEEIDGEIVVTGYEQNYENKTLTQAQIAKLNTYMQENIVE